MSFLFDLVAVTVGAALVIVGVFLVYVPAGFVVSGAILVVAAYFRRALEVLNGHS